LKVYLFSYIIIAQHSLVLPRRVTLMNKVLAIALASLATIFVFIMTPATGQAQSNASYDVDPSLLQALEWRNIGPFRGGRVTAVAGHPDQPSTYYMGATGGGVWKTANGGVTWSNVSDGFFNTGTIGAITVAESDSNIIYVGTGESPIRGVSTSHGDGVYKSSDAGRTWVHLGPDKTRQISKIVVDPKNPDVVYVGAQGSPWAATEERGVYRSIDGGANWERVLFINMDTGVSFLSMDASNPRVIYAAMWDHRREPWNVRSGGPGSGLYKTTDGGDSWQKLEQGLPSLMGNTGISVSRANPDRVWAMIEAVDGGVFRSDDAGQTWKHVNDDPGIRDRGWYYTHIFADPQDEMTVYVLAASMVKSVDGGVTFEAVATPHGDNHDLWINPANNHWMVQGNDGGANVSFDKGQSWSTQSNQPTAQFYRVIVDNVFPYRLYGGQQDNSTVRIPSRTLENGISTRHFQAVAGGESAHIAFDPDNPVLIYGTSILGSISELNTETKEMRSLEPYPYFAGFRPGKELRYRFNWNAPVVVSMHDPSVIYHGSQVVLKSGNRGQSWAAISPDLTRNEESKQGTIGGPVMIEGAGGEHYGTLMYIAESPHDAGTIWTGSDDGRVYVTRDGGNEWKDVTPRRMPEAQVNTVEVSPHDPATAYIAVTRYKFNDFTPMAYKTDDYGRSWTSIVKGIGAEDFVRVVREDPAQRGLLYAGTESGVYVSFDDGRQWQPLQLNLPEVPVTDLRVHDNDLIAATQGRAFWILDDITPLHQLDKEIESQAVHLFQPSDAYRLDGSSWYRQQAKNPPDGAVIYYAINEAIDDATDEVTLEILDAGGDVIRRFSNSVAEEAKGGFVKGVIAEPPAAPLETSPGTHRYVWNLRHEPYQSVSDTIRYVSMRPYRVAPREYQARLSFAGQSSTESFRVVPDPRREAIPAADWEHQQQLLGEMAELVNDVHSSTMRMRAVATQVISVMEMSESYSQSTSIVARGQALIDKIAAWEIHVAQPELAGNVQDRIAFPSRLLSTQILHLMGAIDQDPPVTAGSELRAQELVDQWAQIKADMRELLEKDLHELNAFLEDSKVPHIVAPAGR
jgi:photosystem II stability/assembly factor-like uncharacterized protein